MIDVERSALQQIVVYENSFYAEIRDQVAETRPRLVIETVVGGFE
jgi:hypothetical protein